MVITFSSVGQNKRGRLVTCSDSNIRWKFIFGSYIPRRRLESVIPKYRCDDWQTDTLLKTFDSSALEPCRSTTPRTEDNSPQSCNSRFSNRYGDKEAKLTDCSFNQIAILKHNKDMWHVSMWMAWFCLLHTYWSKCDAHGVFSISCLTKFHLQGPAA